MLLTNRMMDTWSSGTIDALGRDKQPPLTAQDYRASILDCIKSAKDNDNVVFGQVLIKISDIRGYMDGVAQHIKQLEAELQNTKAELALQEQFCKNMHRDWRTPHTPAPAETVTEVTAKPVEWLSITAYAIAHGKAYSTIAGKKLYFGAGETRRNPHHEGQWQIRADAPYPKKRNN